MMVCGSPPPRFAACFLFPVPIDNQPLLDLLAAVAGRISRALIVLAISISSIPGGRSSHPSHGCTATADTFTPTHSSACLTGFQLCSAVGFIFTQFFEQLFFLRISVQVVCSKSMFQKYTAGSFVFLLVWPPIIFFPCFSCDQTKQRGAMSSRPN